MSELMLDDERKMDQVNPFATDGPGAWSNPYPYSPAEPVVIKENSMWDSADVSPMCLSGISAGGICDNPPANCPISRALEPTREIVPDAAEAGSLDSLYGTTLIPKEQVPNLVPRYCDGVGHECSGRTKGGAATPFPWSVLLLILLILSGLLALAMR